MSYTICRELEILRNLLEGLVPTLVMNTEKARDANKDLARAIVGFHDTLEDDAPIDHVRMDFLEILNQIIRIAEALNLNNPRANVLGDLQSARGRLIRYPQEIEA